MNNPPTTVLAMNSRAYFMFAVACAALHRRRDVIPRP